MSEMADDNDPFEEDIVFDQTDLLGRQDTPYRRGNHSNVISVVPTFMMFLRTIALCIVFVGLGLCASVSQGPMIHLEVMIGIPVSQAFHVFTAHSIGMLFGGILGAKLFEVYNRQFLVFVSIMWIAISVIILPFTLLVSFWWTMITLSAIGAGLSFIFTGSNVLCLDLWGKHGGAYLQALHFSFALGALIAPIVVHPFLMAPTNMPITNNSIPSEVVLSRVPRELQYTNLSLDISTQSFDINSTTMLWSSTDKPTIDDTTELPLSKENHRKPAFTNANLIPEPNKWDRAKIDHDVKEDEQSVTVSSVNITENTNKRNKSSNEVTTMIPTTHSPDPIEQTTTETILTTKVMTTSLPKKTSEDEPQVLSSQEEPTFPIDDTTSNPSTHQGKPFTFSNNSDPEARIMDNIMKTYKQYGITEVHLAFILIGVFLILNSLISAIFLCVNPREPRSKQTDSLPASFFRSKMNTFTLVFALYMFSVEASQGAVHHLLASTHMTNGLPLVSRSIDGQVVFWGLICAVRFICILVIGCFKTKSGRLLLWSTVLIVVGTILLTIGSFDKHDFVLAGVVVVALGLAPILPCCFLWMSQYMRVTHRMCALMIIISSIGNSITHTSLTFISADSHLYALIMLALSVCAVVFLLLAFFIVSLCGSTSPSSSQSLGYHLANQLDDEEGLEMTPSLRDYGDRSNAQNAEPGDARQALLID